MLKVLLLDNIVSFSDYISWKMYIFDINDENNLLLKRSFFMTVKNMIQ